MILSNNAANPAWNQSLNAPFQPMSWRGGGGGYAGVVNVRYGDDPAAVAPMPVVADSTKGGLGIIAVGLIAGFAAYHLLK